MMVQTAPEEAYRKFDDLSRKHIDSLRALTKNIQDARLARDQEQIRKWLKQYDEALERYIPVLMSQARIYWDLEHYPMVERIFRQSAEFCSEHEVWVLNVAHVFFLQARPAPTPPAIAPTRPLRPTPLRPVTAGAHAPAAPRPTAERRGSFFAPRRRPSSRRRSGTTSPSSRSTRATSSTSQPSCSRTCAWRAS